MTNDVRLAGKVTRLPEERVLPSGDKMVAFRLSVPRPPGSSRPGSDWVDCAVWTSKLRRQVSRWAVGDEVEVRGALRRRVFRSAAGVVPLVEIEVREGRRAVLSRADPA
ncbi:single-stranded DNA-binding protein [Nocardioides sp.]|uniref:single-stranded DNA-binding protein n=1 Tax=Nocardioides sp. TaxID=35761 RepID=UPI002CDB6830|nr:single-stranded DNA-binding protein [Nocardioides sp.]HSX66211.1 single-stranded DNA-binding protein [Nocardioides sp.]